MMRFIQQFKRCGRAQCFCYDALQQKCKKINNPWTELKYEMERYHQCYYPRKKALKKEHLKKGTVRAAHPTIHRKLK